jgi:quercetin dioxygenase-like cupin family protein
VPGNGCTYISLRPDSLAEHDIAHYDFVRGSSIHEHSHPQEEVYEVIDGELEMTIDGVAQIARARLVAIVPANVRHSVKALTDGRAIIVDYPLRRDFQ